MKTVVIGARGQLGRDLCPRLGGEVIALDLAEVDITQPQKLREILHSLAPQSVINCAAYNFVDQAEKDGLNALAVNAFAVHTLAMVCRELDCTLVHFSTNYVFGAEGSRSLPYREEDNPGPVSLYGASKLLGEYLVNSLGSHHFIIRTCGLFGVWGVGGKGTNFVETILRLAKDDKPLRVVNDQVCTPTYTVDLAQAVVALISKAPPGLYHLTNAGSCTWFEFARAILKFSGIQKEVQPVTSEQFGAAARRPAYSVLDNTKAVTADVPPLRPWPEALQAYLQERKKR